MLYRCLMSGTEHPYENMESCLGLLSMYHLPGLDEVYFCSILTSLVCLFKIFSERSLI